MNGRAIHVAPVRSRADRRSFLRLPWSIYPGRYPAWVPPLLAQEKQRIDRARNPFFEHGEVELYLARDGDRPVGRVAAVENRLHNEVQGERAAFFGLFETVDDPAVAEALLDAVAAWARERGLDLLRGPASFSTNDECGLLVDGFDDPPTILMPYHPPYYGGLCEGWGLTKAMDLLAFEASTREMRDGRLAKLERLFQRAGHDFRLRPVEMRRFPQELALVRELYNRCWEKNWGFVPMTAAEIDALARELKPVLDPRLALIAMAGDEPVGFALALPDFNQVLRRLDGRLFPLGILKLLWYRRKIDRARVITLGILPEYRRTGLDALLYRGLLEARPRLARAESSWVLEENRLMCQAIEKVGFRRSKTYRMYSRSLA